MRFTRVLFLLAGSTACAVIHAQPLWEVSTGIQFDAVGYHLTEQVNSGYSHQQNSTHFHGGSGLGWHAGASITTGKEAIEFKGSLLISQQRVIAPYTLYSHYSGLGGSSSVDTDGRFEDLFTMVEAPLLLSIGTKRPVRIELGCSPWILLDVDHRDHGTRNSEWWIYTQGSGTSSSTYDESSGDMKPYSKYGISGVFGITGFIKERFTISGSCSVSFLPIYDDQDPYSGHHTIARLSIGYVFKTGWFGS